MQFTKAVFFLLPLLVSSALQEDAQAGAMMDIRGARILATGGSEPPSAFPTHEPTEEPTDEPTDEPTASPTDEPTDEPTDAPTASPTDEPTVEGGGGKGKGGMRKHQRRQRRAI